MPRVSLQVDGVTIDNHKGLMSGTFDVSDREANELAYDAEVMFVVTARVAVPRYKEDSSGDLTRVAVLKVKEAKLVQDPGDVKDLADQFEFDLAVPLPLPFPKTESASSMQTVEELEAAGIPTTTKNDWDDMGRYDVDDDEPIVVTQIETPAQKDSALASFINGDGPQVAREPVAAAAGKSVGDKALEAFLYE